MIACLVVVRASTAHLRRAGEMSIFSMSRMSSFVNASISLVDFPLRWSVSIEAAAWEMAHPQPVKVAAETLLFSIFSWIRILSPQRGLSSSASVVASFNSSLLWGCL